nr:MAG: hypothetical protein [Bacteriophage sp.]
MYIEYVTHGCCRVLHQLREVEDGADAKETMENAVKRLEATGFRRRERPGDLTWTNGETDAYIHFGNSAAAGANIKRDTRHVHTYSSLD